MQYLFPDGFTWGRDGRIPDRRSLQGGRQGREHMGPLQPHPGKVYEGHTGDVACDHYHRYEEDIGIMKDIGLKSYRFSISWARCSPTGRKPNQKGWIFTGDSWKAQRERHKACRDTLSLGPAAKLQDKGGWANRDSVGWFADYAAYMFDKLGDPVPVWIRIMNRGCGIRRALAGQARSGITDFRTALQAAHHLLLSTARRSRHTGKQAAGRDRDNAQHEPRIPRF